MPAKRADRRLALSGPCLLSDAIWQRGAACHQQCPDPGEGPGESMIRSFGIGSCWIPWSHFLRRGRDVADQYPSVRSTCSRSGPPASRLLMFATISVTSWATVGRRATCGITVTSGAARAGSPAAAARATARPMRRGQLSRIERGDQILVHHMLAASDVHQHGASRHHGKRAGAEDALGFPCQRQQADGDIGLIEKRLELIAAMENRDLCGLPG